MCGIHSRRTGGLKEDHVLPSGSPSRLPSQRIARHSGHRRWLFGDAGSDVQRRPQRTQRGGPQADQPDGIRPGQTDHAERGDRPGRRLQPAAPGETDERQIEDAELQTKSFEMLPSLDIDAARNGTSEQLSATDDRITSTTSAGMTWNILDLGVSYARAKQQADEVLIAREKNTRRCRISSGRSAQPIGGPSARSG